jgi:quercetin dioxygenase-like cupin family protein
MKAYRLYNTDAGSSAFQEGTVNVHQHITSSYFFFEQNTPEKRSFDWHPAPRKQYVITLKGSLEFTVSDGSSFIINPGDILIATDTEGSGHKWRMLSEESWSRMYLVLEEGKDDGFVVNSNAVSTVQIA